jgi:hypothetical protein
MNVMISPPAGKRGSTAAMRAKGEGAAASGTWHAFGKIIVPWIRVFFLIKKRRSLKISNSIP